MSLRRAGVAHAPRATTPQGFATAAIAAHHNLCPRAGIAMPGAWPGPTSGSAKHAASGAKSMRKEPADPAA
jgi:hypothetical protein